MLKRSKFNLGHYKLLTCKMGQLVPVTWFEALPGDTIQHATSALVRCAPLVTPVMHPIQVRFHHFFVPNRLLWSNWQNFITGGPDGNDATIHPVMNVSNLNGHSGNNAGVSTLADYLGVPTAGATGDYPINVLPFRAYALIFNEYFRDEDLVNALTVALGDGLDTTTSTTLQNIAWEKDYLTSARPWVTKGPAITLPLGTTAPVTGIGIVDGATAGNNTFRDSKNTNASHPSVSTATGGASSIYVAAQSAGATSNTNFPQVFADLSSATAIDINTVRHAFALQRYEEHRARYGSRYTEYLRFLGVRSSDARLQRPEFLGSSRQIIQFSEVLQTAPTSAGTAGGAGGVGQYGGHGITAVRGNFYRRFFEEHGIVMTLMSVRPRTMYSQRLDRAFVLRSQSKEYYWQKELQHIGQQLIDGSEVDVRIKGQAFGYQDRYDEYRRFESTVAGLFRSGGSLNTWHLSREFGSDPGLNSTFVQCVPSTRIYADTSADNLYVMARHQIRARRLVSREGTSSIY